MEPVSYQISEQINRRFWELQFNSSLKKGLTILACWVIVLGVIAFALDGLVGAVSIATGGVAAVLVVVLVARYFFLPRNAAKAWRDHALLREEMELSLRDEGFSIKQPSAYVDVQWTDIVAWNESTDLLAIYPTLQMAYVIPKVDIGSEHVDFARGRLIASGLPNKGKRRK